MRQGIHPDYDTTTVACVCGEKFETRSTKKSIKVEACSRCHPFYTGQKQKNVSAGGRIERFLKKYGQSEQGKEEKAEEK